MERRFKDSTIAMLVAGFVLSVTLIVGGTLHALPVDDTPTVSVPSAPAESDSIRWVRP